MRKKMNKRWMPPLLAATMLVTTAAPAKILADDPQEPILTETGESSLSAEPSLSAEEPSLIAAPDDQGVTEDQAAAASTDSNAAANANLIAANPTATIAVDPTSIDTKNGTFTVRISNLNTPSGLSRIALAVWGAQNGQNDVIWYTPQRSGSDYLVNVSAKEHGYETGTYHIHCYITDANGLQSFAGGTSTEVQVQNGMTALLSSDERSVQATAIGIDSAASAVSFAIWSVQNGQDDVCWINASRQSDGSWTASLPIKGHKDTGSYSIHCYQTVNGKKNFFDGKTVTVTAPTAKVSVDSASVDKTKGTFRVRISNAQVPAGIQKVAVAVWSQYKGQDDLKWYTASRQGNDYVVDVAAANHKYQDGTYFLHCYITDNNDIASFVGGISQTVTIASGMALQVSNDQMQATITYIGGQGKNLKAAVWSANNGQNDLKWYTLTQDGNTSTVNVPIKNHGDSGTYYVHIYNGSNYMAGSSFRIDPLSATGLTASNQNGQAGSFRLTLSGLRSASGIQQVRIAAWPGNDQSKIHWYTAQKASDGTYYVDVQVSNHGHSFGTYKAHAYAYGNNGVYNFCAGTSVSLSADRYMYVQSTGSYSCRVWIVNPGSNISKVEFATWSQTNGQDDVKWYKANQSGNAWYADITSDNHKHGGTYYSHCYVTNTSGARTYATGTTYQLSYRTPNHNQSMFELAQSFSSDTQYLILVNRGLHRVAIYQGSKGNWSEIKYWPCVVGKASTPTPTGTYKIKGRFDWFGAGHKCWWATQIYDVYYFHTQIYYWDDAPKKILDGTMDAAASLGCIRLEEPNAYFIYTQIPRGTTVHIYN